MTDDRRPRNAVPNVCPECAYQFKGNGFDGIDAHWRARHEHLLRYVDAWPLIRSGAWSLIKSGTWLKSEGFDSAITNGDRKILPARLPREGLVTKVKLPTPVGAIYKAVRELEAAYPGRNFAPDGHLVGSIGEVVAAETLGLTLYRNSHPGHDALDGQGRHVQIKMTAGESLALYDTCERLVVLRVASPVEAEIVYDGPGATIWAACGKLKKNGQRTISITKLRTLAMSASLTSAASPSWPSSAGDHQP
jgi:hypothetical protein